MIPPVLHQVWVGGAPIPEPFREWRAAWVDLHPGWRHFLWLDDEVESMPLRNAGLYTRAPSLVRPESVGQFRADLARYEILYRYGGVYVDLDVEPLRPIDPLLDDECFVGWETDGVWANNAVMGAVAGHPFLDDLLADVGPHVNARANGRVRPNVLTGPQFLTPRLTLDVTVHPSRLFYPYLWSDVGSARELGPFPDAYCIHHWNNTRTNGRRAARTRAQRRALG